MAELSELEGRRYSLGRKTKIHRRVFSFSTIPLIWLFHVVVVHSTVKKCTKKYSTCAEPLFCSLKLLCFDVLVSRRRRRRRVCLSSLFNKERVQTGEKDHCNNFPRARMLP